MALSWITRKFAEMNAYSSDCIKGGWYFAKTKGQAFMMMAHNQWAFLFGNGRPNAHFYNLLAATSIGALYNPELRMFKCPYCDLQRRSKEALRLAMLNPAHQCGKVVSQEKFAHITVHHGESSHTVMMEKEKVTEEVQALVYREREIFVGDIPILRARKDCPKEAVDDAAYLRSRVGIRDVVIGVPDDTEFITNMNNMRRGPKIFKVKDDFDVPFRPPSEIKEGLNYKFPPLSGFTFVNLLPDKRDVIVEDTITVCRQPYIKKKRPTVKETECKDVNLYEVMKGTLLVAIETGIPLEYLDRIKKPKKGSRCLYKISLVHGYDPEQALKDDIDDDLLRNVLRTPYMADQIHKFNKGGLSALGGRITSSLVQPGWSGVLVTRDDVLDPENFRWSNNGICVIQGRAKNGKILNALFPVKAKDVEEFYSLEAHQIPEEHTLEDEMEDLVPPFMGVAADWPEDEFVEDDVIMTPNLHEDEDDYLDDEYGVAVTDRRMIRSDDVEAMVEAQLIRVENLIVDDRMGDAELHDEEHHGALPSSMAEIGESSSHQVASLKNWIVTFVQEFGEQATSHHDCKHDSNIGARSMALFLKPFISGKSLGCEKCWSEVPFQYGKSPSSHRWSSSVATLREFGGTSGHLANVLERVFSNNGFEKSFIDSFLSPLDPRLGELSQEISKILGVSRHVQGLMEEVATKQDVTSVKQVMATSMKILNEQIDGRFGPLKLALENLHDYITEQLSIQQFYNPYPSSIEKFHLDCLRDDDGNLIHKYWLQGFNKVVCSNGVGVSVSRADMMRSIDSMGWVQFPGFKWRTSARLLEIVGGDFSTEHLQHIAQFQKECSFHSQPSGECAVMFEGVRKFGCMKAPGATFVSSTIFPMLNHIRYGNLYHCKAMHVSVGNVALTNVFEEGFCYMQIFAVLIQFIPNSQAEYFLDTFIPKAVQFLGKWPTFEEITSVICAACVKFPHVTAAPVPVILVDHRLQAMHVVSQFGSGDSGYHQLHMPTIQDWYDNMQYIQMSPMRHYVVGGIMKELGKAIKSRTHFLELFRGSPEMVVETLLSPSKMNVLYRAEMKHRIISQLADEEPRLVALLARINTLARNYDLYEDMKFVMDHFLRENLTLNEPIELLYGEKLAEKFGNGMNEIIAQQLEFRYVDKLERIIEKNLGFTEREQDMRIMMRTLIFDSSSWYERLLVHVNGGFMRITASLRSKGEWLEKRLPKPRVQAGVIDTYRYVRARIGHYTGVTAIWACKMTISKFIPYYVVIALLGICASFAFKMVRLVRINKELIEQINIGNKELVVMQHKKTAGKVTAQFMAWAAIITALFNTDLSDQWYTCMQRFKTIMSTLFDDYVTTQADDGSESSLDLGNLDPVSFITVALTESESVVPSFTNVTFEDWLKHKNITNQLGVIPKTQGVHLKMNSLNISSVANNINDSVQSDFMLIGKVGCGKSTKFIKALNTHGSVLMCEPTRALVSNVEESLGVVCEIDASVRMRFHHKAGSNSVTVMTYGFALNWFASGVQNLDDFTFICFDESHILDANMIVFYNWIRMRDPAKKIIKMSATPANHATSFDPEHPVQIEALKSCAVNTFMNEQGQRTAMDMTKHGRVILIFVASYNDVDSSAKILRNKGFQVITADGRTLRNMPNLSERISEAKGEHVYVVATNAIENGVTLNIDVVVDFGEKIDADMDPEGRYLGTRRRKISLSERIQRLGRVGRFKPGVAVRIGSLEESAHEINTTMATEAALKSFAFNVPPCLINVDTELIKNYTKDQVRTASEFELDTIYMAPFVRADGKIPRPIFNEFKHLLLRETKLVICDKYPTSIHSRGWRTVKQYVRDGRSRLSSECEVPIPFHHHNISDDALTRLVDAMQNADPGRGKGVNIPTVKLNEVMQTIQYNESKIPHILAVIESCRDTQQKMLFNMRTATSTFTASSLLNFVNLRFLSNKKLLEAKYEQNITILNELEQVVRSVPTGSDDTTLMEYLRDNPRLAECVLTQSNLTQHIERKYLGKKPIVIGRLLIPCLIAVNVVCLYYVYTVMRANDPKEQVVFEGKRNYNRDKRGEIQFTIAADREAQGYDDSGTNYDNKRSNKGRAKDEIRERTSKNEGNRQNARQYTRAPFKNVYDLEINTFDIVRFVDPDTLMAYCVPSKGMDVEHVVDVITELNADLYEAHDLAKMKPDRLHAYFLRDGDEFGYFVNMTPHKSTRASSKNPLLPIGYPEHNGEMRQTGPAVRLSKQEMREIGFEPDWCVVESSSTNGAPTSAKAAKLPAYKNSVIEQLSRTKAHEVYEELKRKPQVAQQETLEGKTTTNRLIKDIENCVDMESRGDPNFKSMMQRLSHELEKVASVVSWKGREKDDQEPCVEEMRLVKSAVDNAIMVESRKDINEKYTAEELAELYEEDLMHKYPCYYDPKADDESPVYFPTLCHAGWRSVLQGKIDRGELVLLEGKGRRRRTRDPQDSSLSELAVEEGKKKRKDRIREIIDEIREDQGDSWVDNVIPEFKPKSPRQIKIDGAVQSPKPDTQVICESLTSIRGPRSFDHFKSYMVLVDRGGAKQCGFGYGDWLCFNVHFFRDMEKQNDVMEPFTITSHLGKQAYNRKYLARFHNIHKHDWALIPIPFESPKFKSKLKLRPPTQGEEVIIVTPVLGPTGLTYKISQPSVINWDESYGTFWKHRITTNSGQCGSLIVGVVDDYVVGIHALGNAFNGGWNYFTPVTEDVKKLLAQPGHSGKEFAYNNDMIDWGNLVSTRAIESFPIMREILDVVEEQSGGVGEKYLGGNLVLRGYIDRPVNFKHVIKGVRGTFIQFLFDNPRFGWALPLLSQRLPSIMSTESFYMDLLKYDRPIEVGFANEVFANMAFNEVVQIMQQAGFVPGELEYEWNTWNVLEDMNKDSAMGACYHGKKNDWLDGLEDHEIVDAHRESLYRLFDGKMGIWTGALKAELRPKEKVLAKKSRVFTAAPIDVLFGAKTVVDSFNHKFYETHEKAPWTVGINKFNKGWDRLSKRFKNQKGYSFICADGSQFDSSLNPYLFSMICDLRLVFMQPCYLGSTMLRNLYAQIVYTPISTVDGLIVKKFKGNNSGQPSTVVDNTLILMFVIEYSRISLREEHGVSLDMIYAINGDDVLLEAKDGQIPFIQEYFPQYFKHFGLNYNFNEVHVNITEAHYMSCHFVPRGDVIIPKLSEERVIAIMEWERNEDMAAQFSALNAARIEAWGNDRLYDLADSFIDYFARAKHIRQYFYIPEEMIETLYMKTEEEAKAVVLLIKERVGLESLERVLDKHQLVVTQADEESWKSIEGFEPPEEGENPVQQKLRENRNKERYEKAKGKQSSGSSSAQDVPTGNTHAGRTAPIALPAPPARTVWVSPSMRGLVNANMIRQLAMYKPDQMLMRADVANQEAMTQWQNGIAEGMGVQGDQLLTLIQAFMVFCINSGTSTEVTSQEYWQADNGEGQVQVYPLKPFVVNAGKSLRAVMRNLSSVAEGWIRERNRKGTWIPVWASKGGLTDKNYAHVGFDFWIPSDMTTSAELHMHGLMTQTHLSGKPPRDLAMVAMIEGNERAVDYHSGSDTGRGRHNVRGASLN